MITQSGPGIMYILSQLMQKKLAETHQPPEYAGALEEDQQNIIFAEDETGAIWRKETNIELLDKFCREGLVQARKHGHFIVGTGIGINYIGIPGRFLIEDQPAGGRTGFTLWQPLAGGEAYYRSLEDIEEGTARQVYGYWIAVLDSRTLEISEA